MLHHRVGYRRVYQPSAFWTLLLGALWFVGSGALSGCTRTAGPAADDTVQSHGVSASSLPASAGEKNDGEPVAPTSSLLAGDGAAGDETSASQGNGIDVATIPPSARHPIDQIPEGRDYERAIAALDAGDIDTARQIAAQLSKHPTFSPLARAIEAIELIKRGDLDQALQIAEQLSAIPAMRRDAYLIAGEVFHNRLQWVAASDAFHRALEIDPYCVRAHRWLGALYYDSGAMRLATEHLRKVAQLDPADTRALLLSGKIFEDYEQYEEAIRDFRALLQRSPKRPVAVAARLELVNCLIQLRRLDEARSELAKCPQDLPATVAMQAAIAEADGQFEHAARLARQVLEQSPDSIKARLVLSRVLVASGRWDEAIEAVKPMLEKRPYDHRFLMLYGRALLGSGQTERGKQAVERATELKNLFLKFADLHQEAIRYPNDATIRDQLAEYASQLGREDLAASWRRAAEALRQRGTGTSESESDRSPNPTQDESSATVNSAAPAASSN